MHRISKALRLRPNMTCWVWARENAQMIVPTIFRCCLYRQRKCIDVLWIAAHNNLVLCFQLLCETHSPPCFCRKLSIYSLSIVTILLLLRNLICSQHNQHDEISTHFADITYLFIDAGKNILINVLLDLRDQLHDFKWRCIFRWNKNDFFKGLNRWLILSHLFHMAH